MVNFWLFQIILHNIIVIIRLFNILVSFILGLFCAVMTIRYHSYNDSRISDTKKNFVAIRSSPEKLFFVRSRNSILIYIL